MLRPRFKHCSSIPTVVVGGAQTVWFESGSRRGSRKGGRVSLPRGSSKLLWPDADKARIWLTPPFCAWINQNRGWLHRAGSQSLINYSRHAFDPRLLRKDVSSKNKWLREIMLMAQRGRGILDSRSEGGIEGLRHFRSVCGMSKQRSQFGQASLNTASEGFSSDFAEDLAVVSVLRCPSSSATAVSRVFELSGQTT